MKTMDAMPWRRRPQGRERTSWLTRAVLRVDFTFEGLARDPSDGLVGASDRSHLARPTDIRRQWPAERSCIQILITLSKNSRRDGGIRTRGLLLPKLLQAVHAQLGAYV